jgi:hypothetical protein
MSFTVLRGTAPAQSAGGGTSATPIGSVPSSFSQAGYSPSKITVISPTLVTGVTTNTATINVRQLRAGAAVATIGTLPLVSGTNLAAETEVAVPVTGSPVLLDSDVLDVQLVQGGTGLVLPAGIVVQVELD